MTPTKEPWTATDGIKVAIDQFVQAPVFTVLIFAFLGFLERKDFEAVRKQLDDDSADTMIANCKYCMEQEKKERKKESGPFL